MKRKLLSKIATAILLISVLNTVASNSAGKQTGAKSTSPNVVFIICDDLNDALGSLGGHPQALTPNLDKLASKGVSFINAHTNAPICGPSRASLWSGLYPHTTGYYGYKQQANHWRNNPNLKNTVTLFEHMADNDYQVYATGKIHHNGHEDMSIFKNSDGSNGFSVNPSFGPYPWDGKSSTNNVQDRGVTHPLMPEEFQTYGCWESFGPVMDLSETMDGNGTWLYTHNGGEYHYLSEDDRDFMPDEKCVEYLNEVVQNEHDKPFFMTVGLNRPHTPFYVPEKYFDMFSLDTLELAPYLQNDLDDCAAALRNGDFNAAGYSKYQKLVNSSDTALMLKWTQAYLACVAFVDDQIGKIVEAVDNSEYADNTLIIVTSDHGYHMGEKKYTFKNTLWEESTRIPLIISGLNTPQDKICNKPVSLIDMYPTLIEYCGLPGNPNNSTNKLALDGHSIKPLILDPENGEWEGDDFALIAIASNHPLETNEPGLAIDNHFSIRTEQYRYTLCRDGGEELYDHETDPYEWTNLADNSEYTAIKEELKNKLADAIKPGPDQVITFNRIGDHKPTDAPFKVYAKANSGLAVTFSIVSGPATIDGDVITLTGETGMVKVRATQEGDDYYNEVSEDQSFEVKNFVNLLWNGDFEEGDEGWSNLANNGAVAQYSTPSEGSAHGEKHMQVVVEFIGSNNWDAQSISTPFDVNQSHNYQVSFMAKADQQRSIKLVVQESDYIATDFTITNEWVNYIWEFKPNESTKSVRFNYLQVGTYYIDNIQVVDLDAEEEDTTSVNFNKIRTGQIVYPNPFTNTIHLNTPQEAISVKIYDTTGKEVFNKSNENGIKTISGIGHLNKGVYLLVLETENGQDSLKILKD